MPTQTFFFSTPQSPSQTAAGFRLSPDGRGARRRISPLSGRALEILGHAIEYLADECALSAEQLGGLDSEDPRVEAIQVLMAANRQVYYCCPEVESAMRRMARWAWGARSMGRPKQPLG